MASLAVYCRQRGYSVTGSDIGKSFHTDSMLDNYSIVVNQGFSADNIDTNIDQIIYSGAYDKNVNPEIKKGIELNIDTITHAQALANYFNKQKGIAVSGSHGKTTTSAMSSWVFEKMGLNPSYLIGAASIIGLKSTGQYGKGEYFIAEADEYQTAVGADKKPRFLWLKPRILVINNIDFDHPDVYRNLKQVKDAFKKLIKTVWQGNMYL